MVWGQNQRNRNNRNNNRNNAGRRRGPPGGMNAMGSSPPSLLDEPARMGGMGPPGGRYGGRMDDDLTVLHQQRLQEELRLRESQLALASDLLQKQNQLMMDVSMPGPSMRQMGGRSMMPSMFDFPSQPDFDVKRRRRNSPSPIDRQRGRNRSGDYNRRQNYDRPQGRRDRNSGGRPKMDSGERRKRPWRNSDNTQISETPSRSPNRGGATEEQTSGFKKKFMAYCKVCDQELNHPYQRHVRMKLHIKRLAQVRKGCAWCMVKNFKNFSEVLKHRETDKHRENAQKFNQRTDDQTKGSNSAKKSKPRDPFPDLQFDAEKVVGDSFVVQVTGYFCKLCHKFYSLENAAKVTHCQSQGHFNMFKKAKTAAYEKEMYLKRKKEREAREAAKAKETAAKEDKKEGEEEAMDQETTAEPPAPTEGEEQNGKTEDQPASEEQTEEAVAAAASEDMQQENDVKTEEADEPVAQTEEQAQKPVQSEAEEKSEAVDLNVDTEFVGELAEDEENELLLKTENEGDDDAAEIGEEAGALDEATPSAGAEDESKDEEKEESKDEEKMEDDAESIGSSDGKVVTPTRGRGRARRGRSSKK